MDHVLMTPISKLAEVDPVFREVVSKLYPDVDPRELWDLSKGMPDQSSVNPPAPVGSKRKKALAAGLLFGTTAEGAATLRAGQAAFKPKVPKVNPAQGELFPKPKVGVKGAFKALKSEHGGKGEFALQAANMIVGLGAAKELFSKPKQPKQPKQSNQLAFAKMFTEACEPIIKARRDGAIDTETALQLIEDVEKGIIFDLKETRAVLRNPHGVVALKTTGKGAKQFANETQEQTARAIHDGRKLVGGVAAAGTAAVGVHAGKKAERKKLQTPIIPPQSGVKKSHEVDFGFEGEIAKSDDEKRQVFGWCSLSTVDGKPVVDLQNDYISIEEIEKSAYDYVKSSRKGGDMHARLADQPVHTSDMIESVIVTPEKLRSMGVPESAISKVNTGWWVGFQVNDEEQWRKVKSGERTGFSIHGKGARVEKVLDD